MEVVRKHLWNNVPGEYIKEPDIVAYIPKNKTSECAVIIFPGGGYGRLTPYEGEDYAVFWQKMEYAHLCVNIE